ncbi:hypothetical protein GGQ92_001654 [Gracilibacillus halotolerans]|uniref:Uncharacterized protein n=1 Tax=Gracilibacillus halotolerans TaxID=74386 RepID=A0A841RNW2_9BACI|nr:hypothetical protein [Gracilibacillus halotolerans]MBB6512865.1 hypothetical protein [Gracilibacillus halotolerans]
MAKKICLLSTSNLKHMTLSALYTDYMDKHNIDYDIIYIDKYQIDESHNASNAYKYELNIKKEWSFIRKWIHYWGFKRFATKILIENNYDFIIVWNEFTAFMFADVLKRNFAGKYCLNIRDYHHFNLFFVFNRLKKAIEPSAFTTVASDAFIPFLPKKDYLMIHSLNNRFLRELSPHTNLKPKDKPIKILYLGYMNFPQHAIKLIDELANDNRYILHFIGAGTEMIGEYIKDKKIQNVVQRGRFDPSETPNILKDVDIIYALYDVGNKFVDTAISIKLYYAIYLNIPIIVFKNTYMEKISHRLGIGFIIEKDNYYNVGNELYEWYHSLDIRTISKSRSEFLKSIKISHDMLEEKMNIHIK